MLVYPTLDKGLRDAWDLLEGQAVRGELTDKGYKRRLHKILEKAGLLMSQEGHKDLLKKQEEKEEEAKLEKIKDGEFESLDTCKVEYKKLQEQVKSLQAQLGLNENQHGKDRDGIKVEDALTIESHEKHWQRISLLQAFYTWTWLISNDDDQH